MTSKEHGDIDFKEYDGPPSCVDIVPWTSSSKFYGEVIEWVSSDAHGLYGPKITEIRTIFYKLTEGEIMDRIIMKRKNKQQKDSKSQRTGSKHHVYTIAFVYEITNDIDDLIYIGSTVRTIDERMDEHIEDAERQLTNQPLYIHMRTHGVKYFTILTVEIVKNCTRKELRMVENKHIIERRSVLCGLNSIYASATCHHGMSMYSCSSCKYVYHCIPHKKYLRNCVKCMHNDPMSIMCDHMKIKRYCHFCNECKCCGVICTPQHLLTEDHQYLMAEMEEQDARVAKAQSRAQYCCKQYEKICIHRIHHHLISRCKNARFMMISSQIQSKKQSEKPKGSKTLEVKYRDAFEVYMESFNQAEN